MPKQLTMVEALNLALDEAMAGDPDVCMMGQDIGVNGGVFRVTKGLQEKYGARRVMDTPLAECGIVGTAVGMAISGLKPVAEIQFSGFTMQAFDQIEQNMARFRNRTRHRYPIRMVLRTPYGGGIRAVEHHSESREAYWAHTPGLKVVIPSGPRNARALLAAAIADPDPVVFYEPKMVYRAFREDVPDEPDIMEIIARLNETVFSSLIAPIRRVTGFDTHFPYLQVEEHYLPDPDSIAIAVRETMAFDPTA
jgi:pyruvate dehydrogenase E1 component beta subunit